MYWEWSACSVAEDQGVLGEAARDRAGKGVQASLRGLAFSISVKGTKGGFQATIKACELVTNLATSSRPRCW